MSNKLSISGIDELINKLEKIGRAGKTVANKALKEAGRVVVAQQKIDAPRHKGGPSNGKTKHGGDALKVGRIRTSKSKNSYVQIGITDAKVWEYAKGIYFQHHGFYNHRAKKYIAGSQWVTKSFKKVKKEAAKVMKDALKKEITW